MKLYSPRFPNQFLSLVKCAMMVFVFFLANHPARASLPAGWSDADIGSSGLAGSASYAGGAWTVTGGGSDIWNKADQFNFASTNFTGDGTMIIQVISLQNSDPSSGWSKAGLMFRNDVLLPSSDKPTHY